VTNAEKAIKNKRVRKANEIFGRLENDLDSVSANQMLMAFSVAMDTPESTMRSRFKKIKGVKSMKELEGAF